MTNTFRSMLLVAAGLVYAATVPSGAAAAAGDRGRALYEGNCAVCHGTDGRADTPVGRLLRNRPRNFADPVEMARVTRDRLYRAIEAGRPGTAMAGWGGILSEAEIGDVMDYVRRLAPPPALTTERLSLEVGRLVYRKECAACHGANGRPGADVRKVLDPAPRDFSDPIDMARIDGGRMYAAINAGVDQSAMPGWGGRLTPAEVADVTRYIRSLARPLPASMAPRDLDLLVGAQIYQRYCAACHGNKGDAKTPLGRALVPPPWDFTDTAAMARVSDEAMEQAITNGRAGTSMARWSGILNPEDTRRVVLFIRQMLQHQAQ